MLTKIGFKQFDSPMEEKLYNAFEKLNLIPELQYPVGVFRIDMAFPEIKVAIECDGWKFHTNEDNWKRDKYRDTRIKQEGWIIERFQGWLINRYPIACAGKIGLKYMKEKMTTKSISEAEGALEIMLLRSTR